MALDALKGYLQLASGLGELTRAKATEAADGLLSLSSSMVSAPVASQVASLADELMSAASANRESVKALVRAEVESAVAHALAAPGGELDRARLAMARLSTDLEEIRGQVLGSPVLRTVTGSGAAAIAALTGQLGRGDSHDVASSRPEHDHQNKVPTEAQQGSPASSAIIRSEVSMATTTTAPTARKAVVKKAPPAKKAAVKRTTAATKATPAKKAVVKKAAPATKVTAKAPAVTKTAVTKTVVTKTTASKAAPAKTTTAKTTTAKK